MLVRESVKHGAGFLGQQKKGYLASLWIFNNETTNAWKSTEQVLEVKKVAALEQPVPAHAIGSPRSDKTTGRNGDLRLLTSSGHAFPDPLIGRIGTR